MPLLVLTDFSPAADYSLAYADALAAHLHTRVVLLHVRRTSYLDQEALSGTLSPLSEGEIAAALAERVANMKVTATVEATTDRVLEATREAIQRHQPLLLVVGKPAAADASPEVVIRTTALELLGNIGCPLLVVPEHAVAIIPPARVTIAADNKPFSLHGLSTRTPEWLRRLGAIFTVAHVVEPEDNDSCQQAREQVLNSGLLPAEPLPLGHGVRNLSVADGIRQGVRETRADLLLMLARRHKLFGGFFHRSSTAQLIRRTIVPLLILPVEG